MEGTRPETSGTSPPEPKLAFGRRERRVLRSGVLGLLGLIAIGAAWAAPRIEDDLRSRSRVALERAGLPGDLLHLDGRDAELHGLVSSPREREAAEAAVATVRGIRRLESELSVRTSAPALVPPRVALRVAEDGLHLVGLLPDEGIRWSLLAQAETTFGAGRFVDDLEVRKGVGAPAWLDRLPRLVELAASPDFTVAQIQIFDRTLTLLGQTTDAEAGERLRRGAEEAFPELAIEDRLRLLAEAGGQPAPSPN